uniref:2-hydroxymuconic semialdehyde dehydrogenase n=1 Tax=Ectopseudomonas oleovorans TaxID=301 RepID=A0A653BDF6_ECTOL
MASGFSARTFENRNPADNSLIGLVHEAAEAEVDAAVRRARSAERSLGQDDHDPAYGAGTRSLKASSAVTTSSSPPRWRIPESRPTWPGTSISRVVPPTSRFADLVKNVPAESFVMDTPMAARR